jgi:hypothetical protein
MRRNLRWDFIIPANSHIHLVASSCNAPYDLLPPRRDGVVDGPITGQNCPVLENARTA